MPIHTTEVAPHVRKRAARQPFPEHLPRERVVEPAPTACHCCGGNRLRKLGEDITETLEVVPRQWKVIQHVREKFTCRDCESISQAPAPFHATPRGWAGPGLLAMILFEKFGQHQPLNRQAERYARVAAELGEDQDWLFDIAGEMEPEGVAHLRTVFEISERRACSIIKADRKMVRYRSRRPPDTALRERLRSLAVERRRFGYRRLFVLLRREGEPSGKNRIYRLYREEGLTVRKRRIRRRAVGTRTPILVEARVNARWSLDFVHDQLAGGRRFRILNVVDDVTRECLAAIADTSISGRRVARDLTALIERRGRPGMIVSDNVLSLEARVNVEQAGLVAPGNAGRQGYVDPSGLHC